MADGENGTEYGFP